MSNKNKTPEEFPEEKPSIADKLASSRFVLWVENNSRQAAIALVAVGAIFVLLFYSYYAKSQQGIKQITMSQSLAANIKKHPRIVDNEKDQVQAETGRKNLQELQDIIAGNSDLQRRYNGLLAQEYLLLQDTSKIADYADRAADNLEDIGLNAYAKFSEVVKLSGEKQFEEASNKAQELYKEVTENGRGNTIVLRAFLLLQMTFLQEKLGNMAEAKETENTLKELLTIDNLGPEEKEQVTKIANLLEDTHITLFEYLDREVLKENK